MKNLILWLSIALLISACSGRGHKSLELNSPGGNVGIHFQLDEQGKPFYQAWFNDTLVLDTSYLGFSLNKAAGLEGDFEVIGDVQTTFDETWEQPWGEQQFIRNHYNELKVSLQEKQALRRKLDIVFRVYDDGFGFRYEFPEQENLKQIEIRDELTEFNMTGDHTAWWIPGLEADQYEYLYRKTTTAQMGLAHTPVTFRSAGDVYISIHEAALKDYSSMMLAANGTTRLKCALVPYSTTEESKAFLSAPGAAPWRTVQLAATPGDLITSYLILNLNEPNQLGDVSWFKPAKYIGIWWEMHIGLGTWATGALHAATTENTKKTLTLRHCMDLMVY